jgi:hypothetical protein
MLLIIPVAKAGQGAVAAGLPSILGSRLAVHLQNAAARSPQKTPNQVQIVNLDRGGGSLHGLIKALENCGHQRWSGT